MCQSKAEGGRRCPAHSKGRCPAHSKGRCRPTAAIRPPKPGALPAMPWDYEPQRGLVSRLLEPTLTDSGRRLFWYRRLGYKGPIDQDGYPCKGDPILRALRAR